MWTCPVARTFERAGSPASRGQSVFASDPLVVVGAVRGGPVGRDSVGRCRGLRPPLRALVLSPVKRGHWPLTPHRTQLMKCQGPGKWGPGGGCVGGCEKGVLVWRTEYRPTLGGSRAPRGGEPRSPICGQEGRQYFPPGCWGPREVPGPGLTSCSGQRP